MPTKKTPKRTKAKTKMEPSRLESGLVALLDEVASLRKEIRILRGDIGVARGPGPGQAAASGGTIQSDSIRTQRNLSTMDALDLCGPHLGRVLADFATDINRALESGDQEKMAEAGRMLAGRSREEIKLLVEHGLSPQGRLMPGEEMADDDDEEGAT